MIKRLLVFLFVFQLLNPGAKAQLDTGFVKSRIGICADSMVIGFRTHNWELYTRYSYPAIIASLGGKESFIRFISESFGAIPDSAWKKYEAGKILQVVKTDGDLQAVIEISMVLHWQGMRISTTDYLVGESWDGGMFWTFFDSQGDVNAARTIKPDLSPAVIIPKKIEKVEPLNVPQKNTKGQ